MFCTVVSVVAFAELLLALGSLVLPETKAVLEMVVPFGVPAPTLTTNVNVPDVFADMFALEQEIVPVLPTDGVEQVKPARLASETNVVFVGTVSVITTLTALLGPVFVTMIV